MLLALSSLLGATGGIPSFNRLLCRAASEFAVAHGRRLHVVALTRALGEQLSPKEEQPELFRWTDAAASHVTCEFRNGKLSVNGKTPQVPPMFGGQSPAQPPVAPELSVPPAGG